MTTSLRPPAPGPKVGEISVTSGVLPQRAVPRPSAEVDEGVRDQVLTRRKAVHAQALKDERDQRAAASQVAADAPKAPDTTEPIESMELELPNGHIVLFGPPPGISLTMRLLDFFGAYQPSPSDERITRVCMCIRAIDGEERTCPNVIMREAMAIEIGDDGLDLLVYALRTYWPAPKITDLKVLKKNLR